MNKDTSNFISLDGQEPSNNRANFQLGPLQQFILILRDDFPQLVSDERTQIRYLALESLQQNHPISHMRHQLEADDYLRRFSAEQRGELAYQISQEFAGVWFPPDENELAQPIQPSADGPPAAQWALLVDSIMQSANIETDAELGEKWQETEFTIRSMTKGTPIYEQYLSLERSHTDEIFIAQCQWALKGLMAGIRAAEAGQDAPEPKFVWQQSVLHGMEVQSYLLLAKDSPASYVYSYRLARIHRKDQQLKCVSAYWHFAKIGRFIVERGIDIEGYVSQEETPNN